MGKVGRPKHVWTKEEDDKLLEGVKQRKTLLQLHMSIGVCPEYIRLRLEDMGFDGIRDARAVLCD